MKTMDTPRWIVEAKTKEIPRVTPKELKVKVKLSRYRPGQALGDPGG
jgi:hypothetical protein